MQSLTKNCFFAIVHGSQFLRHLRNLTYWRFKMAQKITSSLVQEITNYINLLRTSRATNPSYNEFAYAVITKHKDALTDEDIFSIIDADKTADIFIVQAVIRSGALSVKATLKILSLYNWNEVLSELAMDAYPHRNVLLKILQSMSESSCKHFVRSLNYATKKNILEMSDIQKLEYEYGRPARNSSEVGSAAIAFLEM